MNINIHENRMGKRLKQFWFMKQEIDVYDFLKLKHSQKALLDEGGILCIHYMYLCCS